jgi:dienelactone hydrolase
MIGSKLLALSILQRWMAKIVQLPAPGGKHSVGTREITLTHPELLDANGKARKIGIKAWYPAESDSKPFETYFSNEQMGQLYAREDANRYAYLAYVNTHSIPEAPFAKLDALAPVLFFSHGHSLSNRTNTLVCEHLASNGYVVFAIGHTGEGFCTLIDGEMVGYDDAIMEPLVEEGKKFFEAHKDINIKDHAAEYIRMMIEENDAMAERVAIWTQDIQLAADWVDDDKDAFFSGKLITGKFAALGHSIGGASALRLLKVDERFCCAVNMDGGQFGRDYLDWKTNRPMMVLSGNIEGLRSGYRPDQKNAYWVNIRDANHLFFSDGMLVYGNIPKLLIRGKCIDGHRMLEILKTMLETFFGRDMLEKPVSVQETADTIPEIRYVFEEEREG